jgi:hypothetical protein
MERARQQRHASAGETANRLEALQQRRQQLVKIQAQLQPFTFQ